MTIFVLDQCKHCVFIEKHSKKKKKVKTHTYRSIRKYRKRIFLVNSFVYRNDWNDLRFISFRPALDFLGTCFIAETAQNHFN